MVVARCYRRAALKRNLGKALAGMSRIVDLDRHLLEKHGVRAGLHDLADSLDAEFATIEFSRGPQAADILD